MDMGLTARAIPALRFLDCPTMRNPPPGHLPDFIGQPLPRFGGQFPGESNLEMTGNHPPWPLIPVGHRKEVLAVLRPPREVGTATRHQVIPPLAAVSFKVAPKLTGVPAPLPTEISRKPLGTAVVGTVFDMAGVHVIEGHACVPSLPGRPGLPLIGLQKPVASRGHIPLAPQEPHPAVPRWAATRHKPSPCSRAASCSWCCTWSRWKNTRMPWTRGS